MPLDKQEVRLELLRMVVPQMSKLGMEKGEAVKICSQLEDYVLDSKVNTGVPPKPRETLSRKKSQ